MSLRQYLLNHFLLPQAFDRQWMPEDTHRADFICPQAFGRNAYLDDGALLRIRNWFRRLLGKEEIRHVGKIVRTKHDELGDDIATFEWLKSQKFDPGFPNVLLAEMCFDLANILDKPIIGQWEVLYEIYHRWPKWYQDRKDQLFAIWPPTEGYLATRGLFSEVKRIADERGWKTPLLVAHPEHIQRCFFLGKKVFSTTPAITTGTISDGWFDPKSVQMWTRGKWIWLFYELCLARPHHWLKGWF